MGTFQKTRWLNFFVINNKTVFCELADALSKSATPGGTKVLFSHVRNSPSFMKFVYNSGI